MNSLNVVLILFSIVNFLWAVDYCFNSGSKKSRSAADWISYELQNIGAIIVGAVSIHVIHVSTQINYTPSPELIALTIGMAIKSIGSLLFCRLKKSIIFRRKMLDS